MKGTKSTSSAQGLKKTSLEGFDLVIFCGARDRLSPRGRLVLKIIG